MSRQVKRQVEGVGGRLGGGTRPVREGGGGLGAGHGTPCRDGGDRRVGVNRWIRPIPTVSLGHLVFDAVAAAFRQAGTVSVGGSFATY